MSKISLEEGTKILSGYDQGAITLQEAQKILTGKGVKTEKAKPTGPTKTFTALSERIAAMDARLDALSGRDEKVQGGGKVSDEEALRLLEGK